MRKDLLDASNAPVGLRPSFASAFPDSCCLQPPAPAGLARPEKMNKSYGDHGVTCSEHLDCCQLADGEANQQRPKNGDIQIQATNGDFKRSHLKFENKATSSRQTLFLSSREILVRECVILTSAIRRAAAGCVTPSTGADEDDLPYMQLDKVTHAVRRETFGPLYLVT